MGRVNKELMPIKAHYFLFNAATGPIVAFLSTIAKQFGFSASLAGTMYGILPFCGLVAKPLFGGLADKYRLHKTLCLIFQAIIAISFFGIYFIPEIEHSESANITLICHGEAFIEIHSLNEFTDKTLEPFHNTNITEAPCDLSCLSTFNVSEKICRDWGIKQFCSSTNFNNSQDSNFNITAYVKINPTLSTNHLVTLRVLSVAYNANSEHHLPICQLPLHTTCNMACPKSPEMKPFLHEIPHDIEQSNTSAYQFHLFLWAAIFGWFGMAVVVSIADAICIDLLGDNQEKEYGKQKMWSSVGFGIFNISAGYLVDLFSRGQYEKDYTCLFYILFIVMIFDMAVSTTLKKKSIEDTEVDPSVLWELGSIAREGRVLVFAFWCIGAGMCTGLVWNFLFWHTEDLANTDQKTWFKTLQGLLTGVQCFLGELPFNFISGWVLKKLGHINVMSLVLLVYSVRFMAYSLISNPWIFLIVELLHGPTLGLSWPTMVSYGDKIAPSGTRATMQGLVGAIFEGVGVSIGSLIGGHLMNSYGGVTMFRIYSIGALIWLSIYWILQLLLRKAKAYPIYQGHNHLASYATPSDAILMTMSQELQTY